MRWVVNLFVFSCVLAHARSVAASDTICVINDSSYPVNFRFYNPGYRETLGPIEFNTFQGKTIELGPNAGDQNECVHPTGRDIAMINFRVVVEDVMGDIRYSGLNRAKEGPLGDPMKEIPLSDAANWGQFCYKPSAVGSGEFFKSCGIDNVFDFRDEYTWPAGYLLCDGSTCVYHSGHVGDGLYRIWVVDKGWIYNQEGGELSADAEQKLRQKEEEGQRMLQTREKLAEDLIVRGDRPEVVQLACGVSTELAESLGNRWINYASKGLLVMRESSEKEDDVQFLTGPLPISYSLTDEDEFIKLMFKQYRWARSQCHGSIEECGKGLVRAGIESQGTCVNMLVPNYLSLFEPLNLELEKEFWAERDTD